MKTPDEYRKEFDRLHDEHYDIGTSRTAMKYLFIASVLFFILVVSVPWDTGKDRYTHILAASPLLLAVISSAWLYSYWTNKRKEIEKKTDALTNELLDEAETQTRKEDQQ